MAKEEFLYWRMTETVAPIFDRDRGKRLEYMRKSLLLDQSQLAKKLGVTQQMVSKLERGITPVSRIPVTLYSIYKVFGCLTHHILFNVDEERFNYETINQKYWTKKDSGKGNRGKRPPYDKRKKRRAIVN